MEGEGPDEGAYDQPGGPQLPVDDPFNPGGAELNYDRERINRNIARGGRGCFVPWILVVASTLVSVAALAGR